MCEITGFLIEKKKALLKKNNNRHSLYLIRRAEKARIYRE